MSVEKTNLFFIGPSAQGCGDIRSLLPDSFRIFPPVKRGDISELTRSLPPATIVIVDGVFHACPSVGHAELLQAMRLGWNLWGLSSMGAIRACEMRDFGMKGFGDVYERYAREEDFRDDEVALLHGPLPPFPALSEPLIHLRAAVDELQKQELLSVAKAKEIVHHLKSLWYGKRTLALFQSLIFHAVAESQRSAAENFLSSFDRFRIKNLDVQRFLQIKPWKQNEVIGATLAE